MKSKKSKILLSMIAPAAGLAATACAVIPLTSCGTVDDANISITDEKGSAQTGVEVKYNNARKGKLSTIQLTYDSKKDMKVISVSVGGKKLNTNEYSVNGDVITILPDAMTSKDVTVSTKLSDLATGLSITGKTTAKTFEWFSAGDINVRLVYPNGTISNPLTWGTEYTISLNGSLIEDFNTGYMFLEEGTNLFKIKYLGKAATKLEKEWSVTVTKDPSTTVESIVVQLNRGILQDVYDDETLTPSDFIVTIKYSNGETEEGTYLIDYTCDKLPFVTFTSEQTEATLLFKSTIDETKQLNFKIENITSRKVTGFNVSVAEEAYFFKDEKLDGSLFDVKCKFDKGKERDAIIGSDYVITLEDDPSKTQYSTFEDVPLNNTGKQVLNFQTKDGSVKQRQEIFVGASYSFKDETTFIIPNYTTHVEWFSIIDGDLVYKFTLPFKSLVGRDGNFEIQASMIGEFIYSDVQQSIKNTLKVYRNEVSHNYITPTNVNFASNEILTFAADTSSFTETDDLIFTMVIPNGKALSSSDLTLTRAKE